MHECFDCSRPIDRSTESFCLYKNNLFHAACCKFCVLTNVTGKDPSPPPLPKAPKIDAKKGKVGPGKLNFNKLGTFEKNNDATCKGIYYFYFYI
jgi:hypothetical protein